ncbi:serine/threonine-protein kinase [Lignipirellula cremea]|uniref:Serine/threonine-protein kinase PknB n=1 Tax=Lignipirellula cremea TaxID=2528010 RepID=A0A518DPB9_9BACT|nr:serine/threonine-protein kinase [Lignipirellula cremea]QDU93682.1 Serine/threonine-protein kinase PknB [Lignipirellula cremea]
MNDPQHKDGPPAPGDADSHESSQSWDILAECLEKFLAAWENQSEPALADHLPSAQVLPQVRRMAIYELIKVDLERRCECGVDCRSLEDYAAEFSDFDLLAEAPADFLYEDYHLRRSKGDTVNALAYFQRFPRQAPQLRQLLGLKPPEETETLNQPDKKITLAPGDAIDDFELLIELGEGGFAKVFLARQRSMQRMVALKVSADEGAEPQTLAQFDHPHIVRVYDQRYLAEHRLRLLYMQYVAGGTLSHVIKGLQEIPPDRRVGRHLQEAIAREMERSGQTPSFDSPTLRRQAKSPWAEVVCRLGAQLAAALDYAHGKGVLHRDIKPANVLLSQSGEPKLADFNISFSTEVEGDDAIAHFGGSLAYMSLEQLQACSPRHPVTPQDLDARSDVYSLGVTLWEVLTGERPFPDSASPGDWSQTVDSLIAARQAGPPGLTPVREPGPYDVDGRLKMVLRRCLDPDPANRFASGDELARALSLCLHPIALQLLTPPRHGWRKWVRRFPLAAILLASLAPNIVAAVFNFAYNHEAIMWWLVNSGNPHAQAAFMATQLTINSIAFPIGVAILASYVRKVARHIRRAPPSTADSEIAFVATDEAQFARDRESSLRLGLYAAIIGAVLWGIASFAYPISIRVLAGSLPPAGFFHFVLSLTLCGLIAATYPFFVVSFLSVRVLYPALLRKNLAADSDVRELRLLGRRCGFFLLMAAVVPALGVMASVILQLVSQQANTRVHTVALLVLSVLGAFGFGMTFLLYRRIQGDLNALLRALRPGSRSIDDDYESMP